MPVVTARFILSGLAAPHNGSTAEFQLDSALTIAQVKAHIAQNWPEAYHAIDIQKRRLVVIHSGTVLPDQSTLRDCGCTPTSGPMLHLVLQALTTEKADQRAAGTNAGAANNNNRDVNAEQQCCCIL
eukprot:TRINITY_DN95940_c0_g1_i1.p1 TRINITY_DN95940_c0_g1~~TRINITY_DN95940_c0_g1_i1.p1  ORF type:complete len:127 (+),score=24.69 TRINITY_DN95940_c0_g1_i1:88-468(+)